MVKLGVVDSWCTWASAVITIVLHMVPYTERVGNQATGVVGGCMWVIYLLLFKEILDLLNLYTSLQGM